MLSSNSSFWYTKAMNWFFMALLATFLWSASNHIDKFVLSKYFKSGGVGSIVIFGCLLSLISLPIIFVFNPNVFQIAPIHAVILLCISVITIIGLIFYYAALNRDDPSNIIPLFQLIPITTYIISFLVLGETLTIKQILAGLLIISGALLLSLDLGNKMINLKKQGLFLMIASCSIASVEIVTLKYVALQESFWVTIFWSYVGTGVIGLIAFIFIKKYQTDIIQVVKSNSIGILSINAFNEIINLVAYLAFMYATLRANTTLVTLVNGFQPFFVFIMGIILTLFFPRFGKESLLKKHLFQKIISIVIIFIGTYLSNI